MKRLQLGVNAWRGCVEEGIQFHLWSLWVLHNATWSIFSTSGLSVLYQWHLTGYVGRTFLGFANFYLRFIQGFSIIASPLIVLLKKVTKWLQWNPFTHSTSPNPNPISTDHKNLDYIKSAKRLNYHQTHWALFLAHFDFTVSQCPGSKNTKADSLSCMQPAPSCEHSEECILPELNFVRALTWTLTGRSRTF